MSFYFYSVHHGRCHSLSLLELPGSQSIRSVTVIKSCLIWRNCPFSMVFLTTDHSKQGTQEMKVEQNLCAPVIKSRCTAWTIRHVQPCIPCFKPSRQLDTCRAVSLFLSGMLIQTQLKSSYPKLPSAMQAYIYMYNIPSMTYRLQNTFAVVCPKLLLFSLSQYLHSCQLSNSYGYHLFLQFQSSQYPLG